MEESVNWIYDDGELVAKETTREYDDGRTVVIMQKAFTTICGMKQATETIGRREY